MSTHDQSDERAATCWIRTSDVPRIDAIAAWYETDRRAVLRELISLGLQAVTQGALGVPFVPPHEARAALLAEPGRDAVHTVRLIGGARTRVK
ncbi:hypothetical protein LJ655_03415 [Paraburkholderia sp. MMS20-SJTN17]|uniref:Uncharacterized protein n=1 Tax=Paraburkholderia translucens TaxID=2886945 RepID=A0ABS8K8V6_9BURK|nr:hypothetical protein [Paraburkholderia sp. MMS20-SJTN17]MCC8400949.1 hypothetical protein [Paraburkholderia sp. MMS20-SJTN17]